MKKYTLIYLIAANIALFSCKPEQIEKSELPDVPAASFTITAGKDANHLILTNTTPGAFMFQWELGNGAKSTQPSFEAYFPLKGTFVVTLNAFSKGGISTARQTVTIQEDDTNACSGNIALLSDCSSKIWKLKPSSGSLTVGTPGLTTVYWANTDADVSARSCAFNDEFKFTSKGVFEYDNKGDFWADTDGAGNIIPSGSGITAGCNPSAAWKAPFDVWSSGKHSYAVSGDKLTLNGEGAWMGLYKVGTSSEVSSPQKSVEFKIIEISKTKLVIAAIYPSLEWRFTYESK